MYLNSLNTQIFLFFLYCQSNFFFEHYDLTSEYSLCIKNFQKVQTFISKSAAHTAVKLSHSAGKSTSDSDSSSDSGNSDQTVTQLKVVLKMKMFIANIGTNGFLEFCFIEG